MSLRVRIIAIFVVTLLALLGTLQWVSVDVLLKSYQKLENQFASRNLSSLQTNLKTYIEHLDGQVNDWAPWDDTYQFVIDQNPDYIANNLNDDTLENLNIHAALFLDPEGKIIYAKGIDLQTGEETPVSEGLFDSIQTNLDHYDFDDAEDGVSGIIRLPEGAMAIAARPIMTSQKAGPIRGTLIFGRYIDESFLASVAIPGQKLSAHALVDASLPRKASPVPCRRRDVSSPSSPIRWHMTSPSTIACAISITRKPAATRATK
jgi:sensor domain CHASE-containing protein